MAHTPPGPSYRIVHPPTKPRLGRHYAAEFLVFTLCFSTPRMPLPVDSSACTPDRWRARACTHQGRIYLRVRCPHAVTAVSPARTPSWTLPIVTEEEKGKHRVSSMGFYGTLKMIFYKVSRISAGDYPPVSPPTHFPSAFIHVGIATPCLSLTRLSRQISPLLRRMRSGVTALRRRRFNCPCLYCSAAVLRRYVKINRRDLTHSPFFATSSL